MSIVRVKHNHTYVVMDKTGLEDENLSFKAKGLLAYLLGKPDNWTAKISHLKKVSTDGRDSVKTGLKELEENGYLIRQPIRNPDGTIREWESIILEVPGILPETDFPQVDNPRLINNDFRTSNKKNNNPERKNKEDNTKTSKNPVVVFNSVKFTKKSRTIKTNQKTVQDLNNKYQSITGKGNMGFIFSLVKKYSSGKVLQGLNVLREQEKNVECPRAFLTAAVQKGYTPNGQGSAQSGQNGSTDRGIFEEMEEWKRQVTDTDPDKIEEMINQAREALG